MLATLEDAPLTDEHLVYEPKYDGIRALIEVEPKHGRAGVRIWSRLGNEKSAQFPELVRELERFSRKIRAPIVVDGEIVALDEHGDPTGFQRLQGRINLSSVREDEAPAGVRVAFIAFDILRDGPHDLTSLPLATRRARLERVFATTESDLLRISDLALADGRQLYDTAVARGWEGLIAKRIESQYKLGRRTTDWSKIKLIRRQEFVVAGWTEPRSSRQYFGALLLGVYEKPSGQKKTKDGGPLVYVGHTGSGFDDRELQRVFKLLAPLETKDSPFKDPPKGNERVHWVKPTLVAEVKFTEWTDDNRLRHPIYLGLRDDIDPQTIRREPSPVLQRATTPAARKRARAARDHQASPKHLPDAPARTVVNALVAAIDEIQADGGNGGLQLPDGHVLQITNLKKIFWPGLKLTKGDLFRYYARVSPFILPVVADRPLVMKRFPNGVTGKSFYQQRAPDEVPTGVRVEVLPDDHDVPSRLVGGSLISLLYMTQMAAISQDPWFSRVQSAEMADHAAIDLDPMPGVKFSEILQVARWVREELLALRVEGFAKTSGKSGLHIYIPLPPGTPYQAGQIFCQIVATMVTRKHPKETTIERSVHARGRKVYVDYLQNILGKTLACAYSARASDYAGVSTPVSWEEIEGGFDREDFTIQTVPERLARIGDLWAGLRKSKGVNLRAVEKYLKDA